MIVRVALALIGIFNCANGIYMVVAPDVWYAAVPGVTASGPPNQHFIIDIGLIFLASGVGQLTGARSGSWAGPLAVAGSLWPALHALFHAWGWIAHGLPTQSAVMTAELLGVAAPALAGAVLAWLRNGQIGSAS